LSNTNLVGILEAGLASALGVTTSDVTITSLSSRLLRELSAALRKLVAANLNIGYSVVTTTAASTNLQSKITGTGTGSLVQDLGAAIQTAAAAATTPINMTVSSVTAGTAT
jgi:hypothetical protein